MPPQQPKATFAPTKAAARSNNVVRKAFPKLKKQEMKKNPGKIIIDETTELPEDYYLKRMQQTPPELISKRQNIPTTRIEFDTAAQRATISRIWKQTPNGMDLMMGLPDLLLEILVKLHTKEKKIPKDKVIYNPTHKTNLITRTNNILKKLRTAFKNNPNINSNALKTAAAFYVNGEYRKEDDGHNLFYFDDHGVMSIAIFKSILNEKFILELEKLFVKSYELRMKESEKKKRTIYTGIWAKMNPMNYITKGNNEPSGKFVITKILPLLSPIAQHFLRIVHPDTFHCLNNFPKEAKINDNLFPLSATNFLLPSTEHRIISPHQDSDDEKMTMIFTFGLEAPLVLPNQKISINTKRGDLVMFLGCNYSHYVDSSRLKSTTTQQMRTSFVLFGHKSLKQKPIYHLTKKDALEQFDKEHPEEAAKRAQQRERKKIKK